MRVLENQRHQRIGMHRTQAGCWEDEVGTCPMQNANETRAWALSRAPLIAHKGRGLGSPVSSAYGLPSPNTHPYAPVVAPTSDIEMPWSSSCSGPPHCRRRPHGQSQGARRTVNDIHGGLHGTCNSPETSRSSSASIIGHHMRAVYRHAPVGLQVGALGCRYRSAPPLPAFPHRSPLAKAHLAVRVFDYQAWRF